MLKVLARHKKWVDGCVITESYDSECKSFPQRRRFTATINGWRNFKIYDGPIEGGIAEKVQLCVADIQRRIDAEDEAVFHQKGFFLPSPPST